MAAAADEMAKPPAWMKGSSGLLFSLPLADIVRSALISIGEDTIEATAASPVVVPKVADEYGPLKPTCLACGLEFASRAEQAAHFKTDAHRAALQKRIAGGNGGSGGGGSGGGGPASGDAEGGDKDDDDDDDDEDDDADEGDNGVKGDAAEAIDEDRNDEDDHEEDHPEAGWWLRRDSATVCVVGSGGGGDASTGGGSGGGGVGGGQWAIGLPVALVAPNRKALRFGADYFGGQSGTQVLAQGLRLLGSSWVPGKLPGHH
jgi:hypothetical protein